MYFSTDNPKSQMHKLTVKQPHESLLILSRYRMNGHNARIFYCMGETAVVYTTVVILLTPRKPGGCSWRTANGNEPDVKIATTSLIEKLKCILIQVLQSQDSNMKVCVYRLTRGTTSVRGGIRSNPNLKKNKKI